MGRPWPAAGEPLWLDDDIDRALGYRAWRRRKDAERCPRCGSAESDWVDPVTGRTLRDPAWQGKVLHCEGCAELHHLQPDVERAGPGAYAALVPPEE